MDRTNWVMMRVKCASELVAKKNSITWIIGDVILTIHVCVQLGARSMEGTIIGIFIGFS